VSRRADSDRFIGFSTANDIKNIYYSMIAYSTSIINYSLQLSIQSEMYNIQYTIIKSIPLYAREKRGSYSYIPSSDVWASSSLYAMVVPVIPRTTELLGKVVLE